MRTSDEGVNLIKGFEGLRLQAYLCPAGVWTIGYGHTKGVRKGDVCTEEDAEQMLRDDLIGFERCVTENVEVPLAQNQFDALVSFAFNVGCGAFKGSTLLRKLNAGDPSASDELLRWTKAGGVEVDGLVARRHGEREIFNA
jgi:lysozyme